MAETARALRILVLVWLGISAVPILLMDFVLASYSGKHLLTSSLPIILIPALILAGLSILTDALHEKRQGQDSLNRTLLASLLLVFGFVWGGIELVPIIGSTDSKETVALENELPLRPEVKEEFKMVRNVVPRVTYEGTKRPHYKIANALEYDIEMQEIPDQVADPIDIQINSPFKTISILYPITDGGSLSDLKLLELKIKDSKVETIPLEIVPKINSATSTVTFKLDHDGIFALIRPQKQ